MMKSTGMRMGGVVLALLVGMLFAGCGGSDSPEDVASDFYAAIGDEDAGGDLRHPQRCVGAVRRRRRGRRHLRGGRGEGVRLRECG